MISKVQKWGNSLALRIPKSFAIEAQLEKDALVELALVDGQIVVKLVHPPEWTLAQLLAGVDSENIHHEIEISAPMGNEIW